jgi:Protein of unknown function (DUF3108)
MAAGEVSLRPAGHNGGFAAEPAAATGIGSLTSLRLLRLACGLVAALPALAMLDASGNIGRAQGRLEAKYVVTLGAVPFGRGSWTIDVRDDHFSATANGGTTGLVRFFATGQGSSSVRGPVTAGQPVSGMYSSSISTDKKYDDVRMVMNGNAVRDYVAEPPTIWTPDRVPLTDAHRRGVTDPMTATILRVPGNGDTIVPAACNRTLAIFDGRMRYDLKLSFKRLDRVRSDRGYQGAVVVCMVTFNPIAGHVAERPVIRYLVSLQDMELWLAPIAGTRLMVPYRFQVPTPVGLGLLQASEFVSLPQPARATTGAKAH